MEIPWKVRWTCLVLWCCVPCLAAAAPESTTEEEATTTTTTTEAKPAEEEEKRDGDLDLMTQDQVAILKQINRVNEDGSYTFGYEAADGSFKIETRDVNGNVKGMFGFINEDGELKRVSYSASNGTGFQASGPFNVPPLPGMSLSSDEDYGRSPNILQQRLLQSSRDASTRIDLYPISTPGYDPSDLIPTPRLPIYIFSTTPASTESSTKTTTTTRPVVIQHIPKARPSTTTEATRKTAPYGSYLPKKTSNTNYLTTEAPESDEDQTKKPSVIQVIRPRNGALKKVIVTKRPIIETTTTTTTPPPPPKVVTTTEYYSKEYLQKVKDGPEEETTTTDVRRQLDYDNYPTTPENSNLVTSGTEDNPDVYGGAPTPRPYTTVAYRALFTQVPQHQRILHNSFVQNQNQYLAAAFPTPGPAVNPTQDPARLLPAPPILPENQQPNYNRPEPQRPDEEPPRAFPIPSQPLNRVYPNPYNNPATLQPYDPYNPQVYIPPGLLDNLIRMLLQVRERQLNFPRPPTARNFPELDNRYGPYPQSPVPYPTPQYPYPVPYVPRSNYDPRFADPRLPPYPNAFHAVPPYPYADPYQGASPIRTPFYGPYQGRTPVAPTQDPLVVRMILARGSPNPVERSVTYARVPDSTTSSTTSKPRLGSVRNVQILNPNNEEGDESEKFQRDVKS